VYGATLIMGLFLFGIFVDFGGGLRVKLAFTLLALLWVLTRAVTLQLWYKCRWDLLILLGLPILLGVAHILLQPDVGLLEGLSNLYETISSPLLLLLFPLFFLTGGHRTQRMILVAMGVVALVMLLLALLHVAGIINLASYTSLARAYQVGFIGIDPRQPDMPANFRPLVGLRVGFGLVLGLGFAIAVSWVWTGIILLGIILLMARGMWLGAVLVLALWLVLNRKRYRFKLTKRQVLVAIVVFAVAVGLVVGTDLKDLVTNNITQILGRFDQARQLEDLSTQVRVGHLDAYVEMIMRTPMGGIVGLGPMATLYNSVVGEDIDLTEFASLNLAMWWGIPYLVLYLGWLFGSAWQLWRLRRRPGYTAEDTGLVLGATIFWLAGNTNPLMTSPLGIIALMLIRTRFLELTGYRPVFRKKARAHA
jgi:hypothetical protein